MIKQTLITLWIGLLCGALVSCSNKKEMVEDLDYKGAGGTRYYKDSDGTSYYSTHYSTDHPKGLIGANYAAVDSIISKTNTLRLYKNKPLLVSSFVDVDDVQNSSTFGRMIAEQVASRFTQQGYKVVEMKLRTNSVFVRGTQYPDEGEFFLSRELRDIGFQHDAYAVVVGTYAVGKRRVYVTTKLIRTENSEILASYDYEVPVGPDMKYMLKEAKKTQ